MNKNVSDQLVETLVEAGIQRIYAVTGDSLNHVNATVHRSDKIKWIHVQHEVPGFLSDCIYSGNRTILQIVSAIHFHQDLTMNELF